MNKSILKKVIAILIIAFISNSNNDSKAIGKETSQSGKTDIIENIIPDHNLKTAHLKFNLENQGYVKLEIFNNKGEIVETLIDGDMEPGEYNVFFKTLERIESGSYYYLITLDGELILKKAIIY